MKVLMVHTFHHARGGDSTYALGLSRLLEAAGHAVVPLSMRHPDNEPSPWEHRWLPWVDLRERRGLAAQLALLPRVLWSGAARRLAADLLAETQPDVVHLQHIHRHITPSVLDACDAAGVPVVWTVHDYELVCPEGHLFRHDAPCEACRTGGYREAIRHRCKWGRLGPSVVAATEKALHRARDVWHRVDRFLCPSRFLADTLVRFGVPAQRVVHQPNFVEPGPPPAQGPGAGWLVAGRLAPEKGVAVALQAAAKLPDHPLTICGIGPDEARLRRQAAGLPHVQFTGHLPPEALARALRGSRAVAVPSRWYENFPFAVLEAQAAGRAVVASAIGGIPEQIRSGEDGLLVPPDDPDALANALARLLADPAEAARLGAAGAARVRRELSPEAHLTEILGHYAAVTTRSHR